jgi:hypothetical protein
LSSNAKHSRKHKYKNKNKNKPTTKSTTTQISTCRDHQSHQEQEVGGRRVKGRHGGQEGGGAKDMGGWKREKTTMKTVRAVRRRTTSPHTSHNQSPTSPNLNFRHSRHQNIAQRRTILLHSHRQHPPTRFQAQQSG